jgi:hypothetical protein
MKKPRIAGLFYSCVGRVQLSAALHDEYCLLDNAADS